VIGICICQTRRRHDGAVRTTAPSPFLHVQERRFSPPGGLIVATPAAPAPGVRRRRHPPIRKETKVAEIKVENRNDHRGGGGFKLWWLLPLLLLAALAWWLLGRHKDNDAAPVTDTTTVAPAAAAPAGSPASQPAQPAVQDTTVARSTGAGTAGDTTASSSPANGGQPAANAQDTLIKTDSTKRP